MNNFRRGLSLIAVSLCVGSLFLSTTAHAKYVQTSKVRYAVEYGKSKWYDVDVTFMTGQELNDVTSSFRYQAFGAYAVIFWGKGQAAVIKLSGFYPCGAEFEKTCLPGFGNAKGEDQDGRDWEICTSDFC